MSRVLLLWNSAEYNNRISRKRAFVTIYSRVWRALPQNN